MHSRIAALSPPFPMALRHERPVGAAVEGQVQTMSRSKRLEPCARCRCMTAVRIALPCGRLVTMCIPCSSSFARFLNKRIRELALRAAGAHPPMRVTSPLDTLGSVLHGEVPSLPGAGRDPLQSRSGRFSPDRTRVKQGRLRVSNPQRGDASAGVNPGASVAAPSSPGWAGAAWGSGLDAGAAAACEVLPGVGVVVPMSVTAPLITKGGSLQRVSAAPRRRGKALSLPDVQSQLTPPGSRRSTASPVTVARAKRLRPPTERWADEASAFTASGGGVLSLVQPVHVTR